MKSKTKKIMLKRGTFFGGGRVYPMSQLREVFRAILRKEPLPEPKETA